MKHTTNIREGLSRILGEEGTRKRLLVAGGAGYFVFSVKPDGVAIEVEATAGRHVPDAFALTVEAQRRLVGLGLVQRRASENLRATLSADSETLDRWSEQAPRLLVELYEAKPEEIEVHCRVETYPTLNNKPLLDAMENLAKRRSWPARSAVYMKLVKAELVLALAEPATAHQEGLRLYKAGEMSGRPVAAVFADIAALDYYDPRGLDACVLSGMELFPLLAARKSVSLLLNPGNKPRGELYGNELWTIVEGIKKLSGSH